MPLAMAHGAAVIALTIDEDGHGQNARAQARSRQRDPRYRHRSEYGLAPEDLIFDALTFPLTTGDPEFIDSAVETIEGIRLIEAALPGVLTMLGVSNVSFGINPAARKVLNAVFLYHCIKAGLDLAIVHPSHVVPFAEIPADERELAEDLIFARRPDALPAVIERFEGRTEDAERRRTRSDGGDGCRANGCITGSSIARKRASKPISTKRLRRAATPSKC